MPGRRTRGAAACLVLALAACAPPEREVMVPDSGIPITLAAERAAAIGDLSHELEFVVPGSVDEPVSGRIVSRMTLADASRPLVIDFAPESGTENAVHALAVNGRPAEFTTVNGHIVIPPSELEGGETAVAIDFTAGDRALNRGPDFVYTLFVPALAHTVFPVFDQPDLKARYSLRLTAPEGWTAVSNGAAVSESVDDGRVHVEYAETPPIPTYLFAFAAGRFQVERAERNGRAFRMFHRETDADKVLRNRDRVFDLHATALAELEAYTGIPYPFDKFDFVLVPAFQFNGMEHPGAVYYRDSSILLEQSATQGQRLRRASLIAHETAHMWFGDLVTMRWFDDVWMKEVFANFMAAKIVNPSFPGVDHDLRFLTAHYPAAYGVDRTAGTHPIRQELDNLDEAGGLYGAIIYQKAPIVMRQLESILGEDAFRAGVREYLADFRFGNAEWPDLIERLDERTAIDLAEWSRAWVEQPGRPRIETERGGDGAGLAFLQSDPVQGRGLDWTQRIEALVGSVDDHRAVPVQLAGPRTEVDAPAAPPPDFVLPNGSGLAYGDVVLDAASRRYLLDRFTDFTEPLTRGAIWITLWEEMLGGRVPVGELMDAGLRDLAVEDTEQVAQLLLDGVRGLFWRYSTAASREEIAPRLERTLRAGIERSAASSMKAAYFSTFRSVVTTTGGVAFLERVWRGEESIDGLPLTETDETAVAEELALRSHPRAAGILEEQRERIQNADRQARFDFVVPSLSANADERNRFFDRLADPANREREPWVLDGLTHLNHPLRAEASLEHLRAGLEMLVEVRDTGDIFFPRNWMASQLAGHATPEAADIVRAFLAEQDPDYPPRLRRVILQAADPLFRAVEIREGSANN